MDKLWKTLWKSPSKATHTRTVCTSKKSLDFSDIFFRFVFVFLRRLSGGGHTLTLNINSSDYEAAPFRYVSGATIKNLNVAGTVKTSMQFAGGLVGCAYGGEVVIKSCRSSVNVTGNCLDTCGGFFGGINGTEVVKVTFVDCLFDGTFSGDGRDCGGFVGYDNSRPLYFYNCLVSGTFNAATSGSATFSRKNGEPLNFKNCYYQTSFGTEQGDDATSMSATILAERLGNKWKVESDKVLPIQMN